jgi:predicted CXXCH cytochrome family protein
MNEEKAALMNVGYVGGAAKGVILVLGMLLVTASASLAAEEPACISCHEDLTRGTSVHQAVSLGCLVCHSGVDAAEVPHRMKNKNPKGLASKMRDLCYSCHDRSSFMKTTVHGAMALGCTTCHNPHASQHARLLKENVPALCVGCHQDRFAPGAATGHALAGNEACSSCHNPHAADAPKLILSKQPVQQSAQTAFAR